MTHRHLYLIAAVSAALVQLAFVAAYYAITDGCFCSVTGAGLPEPSPFLWWLLRVAPLPLAAIPARFFPLPFAVGGWGTALVFASINALFWAAGLFALLNGIALLWRIHPASPGARRRFELRSLSTVRPSRVGAAVVVLMGLSLAGGASHRTWWLDDAERAARATLDALREGRPLPHSRYGVECFDTRCPEGPPTGSYDLTRRQHPMVGASVLDAIVPPKEWRGEAVFQDGALYRLRVHRFDGRWEVIVWAGMTAPSPAHARGPTPASAVP